MKIYIAGPITGVNGYEEKFEAAEKYLFEKGHKVMNPATLGKGFEHKEYMHICYAMIDVCDAVYFLEGFSKSIGAALEFEYTRHKDKEIYYQAKGKEINDVKRETA